MSSNSSAAVDDEISNIGDSTEAKVVEADAESDEEAGFPLGRRGFLRKDSDDPKYNEQAHLFLEQVEKCKGFYMDLDQFDYKFAPVKFEWGLKFDDRLSNKDLMDLLIKTAIEAENEDCGTQLELVEYVSANVTAATGYCFYITLLAKDLSLPNPEPKLYQTLVRKFCDEIFVHEFKLKPPQLE